MVSERNAQRRFGVVAALVALLFLGLAYGALVADRRQPGIRSET